MNLESEPMEAQVLAVIDAPLSGPDGREYVAKICGRRSSDSRWEGWVEFVPDGGTPVLRSRRETTQPNLRTLEQWAAGLSAVYLEGSLERTLAMQAPRREAAPVRTEPPHFDGPSPAPMPGDEVPPDDAVLNPVLHLRRGGEAQLRGELAELAPAELRTIARAYGLGESHGAEVDALSADELVEVIVRGAWDRLI